MDNNNELKGDLWERILSTVSRMCLIKVNSSTMSSFQSDQNAVSSANSDKHWLSKFDFKLKTELNLLAKKNFQCNSQFFVLLKKRLLSDSVHIKEIQEEIEPTDENLKCIQPFQQLNQESKESVMKHSPDSIFVDRLIDSLKKEQAISIRLEIENENESQNKQLMSNANLISTLQEACAEKDRQLMEKVQFIENLQAEAKEKEHAQLNIGLIEKLQAQNEANLAQLVMKDTMIAEFQYKEEKLVAQLDSKDSEIRELQSNNDENNERLASIETMLNKFEAIIKIGGSSLVTALEKHASDLIKQQKHEEAIQRYEDAIEIEQLNDNKADKLADLYLWEAQVYEELKQYANARPALNSALHYRPKCLLSLDLRAKVYFELKDFSSAEEDLETILRLDSGDKDAQEFLRRVQNQLNQ